MKGRPAADWQAQAVRLPLRLLTRSLVAAGYSGLWIDRVGYPHRAAQLLRALRQLLGRAPIISIDGRFAYFDLRPFGLRVLRQLGTGPESTLRRMLLFPHPS